MKAILLVSIGIIFGGGTIGGLWWWTVTHTPPKSPYWDIRATDPTYWSNPEREKNSWKLGDMDDCHGLVSWMHSHEYLKWERKAERFSSCMRSKGYVFKDKEDKIGASEESIGSNQESRGKE